MNSILIAIIIILAILVGWLAYRVHGLTEEVMQARNDLHHCQTDLDIKVMQLKAQQGLSRSID